MFIVGGTVFMDKEKNTNGDMQDKSAYYEGLYQDLPKEVVDIESPEWSKR